MKELLLIIELLALIMFLPATWLLLLGIILMLWANNLQIKAHVLRETIKGITPKGK